MTDDYKPDDAITSPEQFEAALAAVVESAIKSGVDVRGAWEFQTRGSTYNWEVEITELAKYFDDETDSPE